MRGIRDFVSIQWLVHLVTSSTMDLKNPQFWQAFGNAGGSVPLVVYALTNALYVE